MGKRCAADLLAIRPDDPDPEARVFAMTGESVANRVRAAALAAGLGDGYGGHSLRRGMCSDLAAHGATLVQLAAGRAVEVVTHASGVRRRRGRGKQRGREATTVKTATVVDSRQPSRTH